MVEESRGQTFLDLFVTLSRIADARQRAYALAERLNDLDADLVVDAIKMICERSLEGEVNFLRLYNALVVYGPLRDTLGEEKLSDVVNAARLREDYRVVAILQDLPSAAGHDCFRQPFLDGTLRETPLGVRKALARRPDFKLLQRIAKDQDHRVIEHLLDNPRMTENEVIKIGATRPTSPKVLEIISRHPRWASRYRVKKTIVFNPYAPLSLALRLLTYLNVQDLELLCTLAEVSETVRCEAQKLLMKKSSGLESEYHLE